MLQSLARPTRLTRVPCIPDIPPFFAQARISSSPRCSSEGFSSFGLRGVWFGFCLSSVRECRSVCRCHPSPIPGSPGPHYLVTRSLLRFSRAASTPGRLGPSRFASESLQFECG